MKECSGTNAQKQTQRDSKPQSPRKSHSATTPLLQPLLVRAIEITQSEEARKIQNVLESKHTTGQAKI